MKIFKRKAITLLAGLLLLAGIAFGTVSVSAATLPLLDYSQVNYTKNLSLPMTNHTWRIHFTNLNKAKSATVSSSDTSVAEAVAYNASLKSGCIYVSPHKKGKTKVNVKYSYVNSSGTTINKNYTVNLTVYGWTNPLSKAKVGKTDHVSKFARTNFAFNVKLCIGKAMVNIVPKTGWTIKGVYLQGLRKSGSSYAYVTEKIPNKKVYNFARYIMRPDLYTVVYNAQKNMTLTLLLAGE